LAQKNCDPGVAGRHDPNRFLIPDFQVSLPFNEKQQADTNCLFIFLPVSVAHKTNRANPGRQRGL